MSASAISPSAMRRSRAVDASVLILQKQLWIWPLVAAVVLTLVAIWVRRNVERTIQANMASDLQAVLSANVTALDLWNEMQQSIGRTVAQDPELEVFASKLESLAIATDNPAAIELALLNSPLQGELREVLAPVLHEHHYRGYLLTSTAGRILASDSVEMIGKVVPQSVRNMFQGVFAGKAIVSRPVASSIAIADTDDSVRAGVPTMFVAAPIRDSQDKIIAVLALRIDPRRDFTRILATARIGASGETYAFDRSGLLLSQSRFDETLKDVGLLPDRAEAHSILNLTLKDPGVDLTSGRRASGRRAEMPLTRMAQSATAGETAYDVQGYRDYRGVPVIGAWTWLPQHDFGVATEIDVSEAFGPLYVLRIAFWGLFSLLALSALAIFIFTLILARMQRAARRAALDLKRLGQYSLDEKIGAGGMGVVYKGHHAMLRRPTAIKLLDVDKVTDAAVARFEREVQLTCQLTHPNTIAIYDYGRTDEGVFYYAMEYLDGLSLEKLVEVDGPQPEGRVIQILAQICGSLAEAHALGLIHRDIKPANVLLNQRGGMFDVVKVLDFGLVKAIDGSQQAQLTATDSMAGTPLYMAPEAIQSPQEVGPAADLYAVGSVGYFLLTGTPPFRGESMVEICRRQVSDAPEPPSRRLGRPVAPDLEAILLQCLAKSPAERPASAQVLAEALLGCGSAGSWTIQLAEDWWRRHGPIAPADTTIEAAQPTQAQLKSTSTLVERSSALGS
ncbi:MAG: serine/threonine protein kinase [Planctomycetaceae bacterium]|nr:serine/threonine protein kinase [Planctomycetaceae bacterium]